jgi:hypothetical protein
MGNAKFYYFSRPAGISYLQTIDLQEGLAELFSEFEIDAQDGVSYTGRRFRTISRLSEIVRIQRDRMKGGEELSRDLNSLQSHLAHGYPTMFSADSEKAYATYLRQPAKAGDTVLYVGPNVYRSFVGNQIVQAGDYLMIESQNPAMFYQQVEVQSITATASSPGTITLANPIQFDFDSGSIGVRWYRFWPSLKRPADNVNTNMISNERGFLWSLDVLMTPDYGVYHDFLIPIGEELGDLSLGILDAADSSDSPLSDSGYCPPDPRQGEGFGNIETEPDISSSVSVQ